ncbi:MAG: M1 family aminopeptidase [Bacteroidota bacterium]
MKKLIAFLLILISGYLQAQVTFHPGDLDNIAKAEQESHSRKLLTRGADFATGYDVKYYRCYWIVDPAIKYISGNITTYFMPTLTSFDTIKFNLTQALKVDSVKYRHTSLPFNHSADLLTIVFPSVLTKNTIDSVSVYYQGIPADDGLGSFVQSTHSGAPIIWTLSEPYGASDWWPCKNGLTDKADSLDVFVSTPSAYKVASNGVLASIKPNGTSHIFHWKHRYPIVTYLICIAVTNYAEYIQRVPFGFDTLEVVNYVYPEDSLVISTHTGVIVPLIKLFDSIFGIYPFQNEKYGHAQFGWGGGMEHQTMTFVSSFGFELLAHELAHSWFGNMVTCGSWADIWLNEGFATFLSGLAYQYLLPNWWLQFKRVRVNSIISKPEGSVWCNDTLNMNRLFDGRLSYAKGAMILNQLRWIIGDQAFFSAANNYLYDVQSSYGFSRTSLLISHFEASYGKDLTWYFDDWFTGQGYPSYHINWKQTGNEVNFTVTQTQSNSSVSFFELPLPIMFRNQVKDTLMRFENTFSGQSFTASIPFAIDTIIIDPDYELISGNNVTSAVEEFIEPTNICIYPNPADDFIILILNNQVNSFQYNIYSTDGKSVKQGIFKQGRDQIDIKTLAKGIYSLVISDKDRSGMKKFIKR